MARDVGCFGNRREIQRLTGFEGAFVQGAGWLTLEDLRWDESVGESRGRLLSRSASTYKLPAWSEMPEELQQAIRNLRRALTRLG